MKDIRNKVRNKNKKTVRESERERERKRKKQAERAREPEGESKRARERAAEYPGLWSVWISWAVVKPVWLLGQHAARGWFEDPCH